jgi:hypothetical protein
MNADHDSLQEQVLELRRQLQALRAEVATYRRGRRGLFVGLLALGLVVLAGIGISLPQLQAQNPAAPQGPQHLVVSSLRVVGPDGKERVTLGSDKISGFVKVHAPDGKVRAAMWTDDKSKFGQLSLLDEASKSRVILTGNEQGAGCNFYGAGEKKHAYIGTASNIEGGIISLFGPKGKTMVHLGHDDAGGLMWVNGLDGKTRSRLWVAKDGQHGLLGLNDGQGKNRVLLGINTNGGFIDLYGTNSNRQVAVHCDEKWGGGLSLFSDKKTKLIFLGPNATNGHGLFQLFGADGKERLEGLVDESGVGTLNGINGKNQIVRTLR